MGLAVGAAVEEGVIVGVRVDVNVMVTKIVGVAVAVGTLHKLNLPVTNEITVARDTRAMAATATPTRQSIRRFAAPIQGSNMVALGGVASVAVPPSASAVPSAFTLDRGEPNSASCISAIL